MSLLATVAEWAQFSPDEEFWMVTAGTMLASLVGFIGGFWFLHRKRTFEIIPTSKIRSAAQGYVELDGKGLLMEGPPINAPLTGIRCTWYNYTIQEHRGSGKNARWVTIEKGTSDELFLLIDDTGKCVIDPEGASVMPAVTDKWYGATPRPQGGSKIRRGIFSGGKFRYTEMRMHPGDTLYAIGLFKTVGGASTELNVNAEVVQLLKEWKADSERLLRSHDHNRDGQIDMHEWEQVRNAALQEVLSHHQEVRTVPPVNVLGKTQDPRRPFILSAIPQQNLIRRYHHYSAALISLFFIAGIPACWLVGLRYYNL